MFEIIYDLIFYALSQRQYAILISAAYFIILFGIPVKTCASTERKSDS